MQKLLIYWVLGASLILSGCSTLKNWGDALTPSLDSLPLMYRPDVQQGNIITQEQINQLHPGMAKRQVRYLMGTPILVDVFHQERWDYIYSLKPNNASREQQRIALFFTGEKLSRIEGDFRPQPLPDQLIVRKESVVSIPDHEPKEKGFIDRALEKVGLGDEEEN